MKNRKTVEKIGVVALVGLCVFLVFRLVSEIMGNPSTSTQTGATVSTSYLNSGPSAGKASQKAGASSSSGSALEMQTLDRYRPKPLPDLSRDPFDFGTAPLTPAQKARLAAGPAAGAAVTASSAPASPKMPLRAIGYSERTGVGPEAYLVDSDDVFIVHNGDVISKRYKVLRITSNIVEVQDGTSGEKAQLPIPVVQ